MQRDYLRDNVRRLKNSRHVECSACPCVYVNTKPFLTQGTTLNIGLLYWLILELKSRIFPFGRFRKIAKSDY
jgi:hypothetical protein